MEVICDQDQILFVIRREMNQEPSSMEMYILPWNLSKLFIWIV